MPASPASLHFTQLSRLGAGLRWFGRESLRHWKRQRWRWLLSFVLTAGIVAAVVANDRKILDAVQLGETASNKTPSQLKTLAGQLSDYGDFMPFSVSVVVGIMLVAVLKKSRHLQRLAMAALLSAGIAGISANVIKGLTGRPRPFLETRENVADGFYGPTRQHKYNSFPSGHTATAVGVAVPLLIACPVLGIPALLIALAVAWSRMYLDQHHLSDVLTSIWIAAFIGTPLGLAVRRLRAAEKLAASQPLPLQEKQPHLHPAAPG